MSEQTTIFLFLGVIVVLLAAANSFLVWRFWQINRKTDEFFKGAKTKDFKEVLLRQKEKNSDLDEQIKNAFAKIKNLEEISLTTIRKTGIIRYNPFKEMGGNQSFVIAMLDDKNNGFVLSSLFVKEGNRVYAKALKAGKAEQTLSEEEKQAIAKAIKS
jgi:hypothetical protein